MIQLEYIITVKLAQIYLEMYSIYVSASGLLWMFLWQRSLFQQIEKLFLQKLGTKWQIRERWKCIWFFQYTELKGRECLKCYTWLVTRDPAKKWHAYIFWEILNNKILSLLHNAQLFFVVPFSVASVSRYL